jgi:hypothetical protein
MAKPEAPERPKARIRIGRIFAFLATLGLLAVVGYGASWLNAHRYFLVVGATEAWVARGRMLPFGHEPYFPDDPILRRAYGRIDLPGGLSMPQGETRFEERADLDDALRRLLKDALTQVLEKPSERTPALASEYLAQLESLPGASLNEERELNVLRRSARRAEAQLLLGRARANLEQATKLLRTADPDDPEAKRRAQALESVLGTLGRLALSGSVASTASTSVAAPIPTSTRGRP